MRRRLFCLSLVVAFCLCAVVPLALSAVPASLVPNGDFSNGIKGWSGECEAKSINGEAALRIASDHTWAVCSSSSFPVAPGASYLVSFRMCLENAVASHCKILWTRVDGTPLDKTFVIRGQDGSVDWKEWRMSVKAPAEAERAVLQFLTGGTTEKEGVTWIDDVSVEPENPAEHARGLRPRFLVECSDALTINAMAPVPRAGDEAVVMSLDGHVIVIPAQPALQDSYAAELLSPLLEAMFQRSFPVVSETEYDGGPAIHVGNTASAKGANVSLCPDVQGYRIAVAGDTFFLQGGEKGALYAVLAFLQEDLGCRFYDPDEPILVPSRRGNDTCSVRVVPREYTPPFEVREPYNGQYYSRQDFNAFNRVQAISFFKNLPPEMGGVGYANTDFFCHTYADLIPAQKFFKSHPEFFPLREGQRVPVERTTGQLCYTAPGVAEAMADGIREHMARKPGFRHYAVSHNDNNYMACECEACQKLIREEGVTGCTLYLVNRVAEILATEHPEVGFSMLAYVETQPLPATLRPHPSVLPIYAPIRERGGAYSQLPWRDVPKIRKEIEAWMHAAKKVYVWDYVTDTRLGAHVDMLDYNIRDWRSLGVKGVFIEDKEFALNVLEGMKTWVAYQKLWNPDWDTDLLVRDYVRGRFGAASSAILRYVEILRNGWNRWYSDASRGPASVPRFTAEELGEMEDLLLDAYIELPGRKVATEIVALYQHLLRSCPRGQEDAYERRMNLALSLINRYGISLWEGNTARHEKVLDSWQENLRDARTGYSCSLESPDSVVLKDKAAKLPGCMEAPSVEGACFPPAMKQPGGTDWGVQWPFQKLLDLVKNQATYVAKLRIRPHLLQERSADTPVFAMRLYRSGFDLTGEGVQGRKVLFGELQNDVWQEVYLYKVYFYSPSVDGVFFQETYGLLEGEYFYTDYIEFVPLEQLSDPSVADGLETITM